MAHNVTPLTAEEQLLLRSRAKAELIRLVAVYADDKLRVIDVYVSRNVPGRLFNR